VQEIGEQCGACGCVLTPQVTDKNWAGYSMPGWIVALNNGGVEFCLASGDNNMDFTAGSGLFDGLWHHVLVVRVALVLLASQPHVVACHNSRHELSMESSDFA
jgi:hypothetical protein